MVFYLIGLGLNLKSISLEALEILKRCKRVYIENYTVEFPYNGKELEKGEAEITIDSKMMMDYKENWGKTKLTKFLRHVYIYLIKKREFERTAGELWKETYDLQDRIKEALDQYTR